MNKRRRERIDNQKKLKEWSRRIRINMTCQVCGSMENLDSHHLLPKERWPEYKFELMNGICVCKKCHKFGKFSFHKNPIWSSEWLKSNHPKLFNWVMNTMKNT